MKNTSSQKDPASRNVGQQTVQLARMYVSPRILSHNRLEKWDYNFVFYTPRTLSTMVLLTMIINIAAYSWSDELIEYFKPYFHDPQNPDVFEKFRWPIAFSFSTVIGFACCHFPDSIIKRPAPIFWRFLMGILLSYSTFMTLVLILPRDEARWIFKIFHPSQGNPLPEKNYADDCRVFTPENPVSQYFNIYENVYDVHFVAHLAGWWFKMMIIRDAKIAWVISFSFELIEISFRHWLANFWECWWDHMFLDLFGCNMFGIFLGSLTIKYIGVSRINWVYEKPKAQQNRVCDQGVILRTMGKLKPDVYTTYNWKMFENLQKYLQVSFYIFFVLSVDAMNFFMKYVLWVSAESDLLKARVAIWGFTAIVTSKEYFEYINDPVSNRVGPFFWLSTYTLFIEYSIWFKFSRGLFDAPFPWYVKVIHVTYGTLFICGALYAYNNGLSTPKSKLDKKFNMIDPDLTIENTQEVLNSKSKNKKKQN